jgi:hypothetical protein
MALLGVAVPRASGLPSPGATRLTLTGICAVPDKFGRIRVLLMTHRREFPDSSWFRLVSAVPCEHPNYRPPYEIFPREDEGVKGVMWAVAPAHRRKFWLETATALRGQRVQLEVTVRPYKRDDITGASLDLSMLAADLEN